MPVYAKVEVFCAGDIIDPHLDQYLRRHPVNLLDKERYAPDLAFHVGNDYVTGALNRGH